MAFKGTLKTGQQLRVVFQSHLQNQGATSFGCFFDARAGGSVPEPVIERVLPGQTDELFNGKVMTGAKRFRVDVDLPPGGTGTLQVSHGDQSWTEVLKDDAVWVFWVEA
ncbi:MAG TPA: hypothetical protein VF794_18050 [Archangium sp.]|jgi:hypothetical protein|uniref:hypothetical protein n=1 Tax=Archangium sp. TaxID=1872627 RepID=UPI002ED9D123